jgi:type I restriction enzyme S subunit
MARDWEHLILGDLGRIVTGKTPLTAVEGNFGGQVPFVTPSDMDGRRTISITARYLTEVGATSVKGSRIPAGSVMVSCIGSDMRKAVIAGRDCVTNQQINSIVVDDRFSSEFVYYNLSTRKSELRHQAAGGSAQPILNKGDFSRIQITLPPLAEQKAIAAVLGALDDKIELNRRMNATLEAMARALFQSWFVDFDPVRAKREGRQPVGLDAETAALFPAAFQDFPIGPIPQGWEVCSLADKIELLSGGTPKTSEPDYWNGDIPWYSLKDAPADSDVWVIQTEKNVTKLGIEHSAAQVLPKNITIISARGTVGKLALTGIPMAMNQSCYGVRGKAGCADFFTYFLLRAATSQLQQHTHGTVFDTITRQTFETLDCTFPPPKLTVAFDHSVKPLLSQLRANLYQSRTLATLRDTLLPKLLSGELRVAAAAKRVEARA